MPPDVRETIDALPYDDLVCEELRDVPTAGHWPEGFVYHFYRARQSTRSTEVAFERDEFSIRILANSSTSDFDVALEFVRAVLSITKTGSIVTTAHSGLEAEEFFEVHDQAWIERTRQADASALFDVASTPGALVRLQGPTRDFYAGPGLVGRLTPWSPETLEAAMRAVFYADRTAYPVAQTLRRWVGHEEVICSVIEPEKAAFVERCDLFAFMSGDEPILVSPGDMDEVLPDRELVDELQFTIDAIDSASWPAIEAKARDVAVDVDDKPPSTWWKFWR